MVEPARGRMSVGGNGDKVVASRDERRLDELRERRRCLSLCKTTRRYNESNFSPFVRSFKVKSGQQGDSQWTSDQTQTSTKKETSRHEDCKPLFHSNLQTNIRNKSTTLSYHSHILLSEERISHHLKASSSRPIFFRTRHVIIHR